jgi:alpha-amylase/alpha-mannosidase (GH57 family)
MTRLAILWHMHQPFYQDLATGEHILPWVRLHALKDYRGMVAILEEFPQIRVTFNLVPSLLVQVQAFADDRAHDRHLIVGLKDAAVLTRDERRFLVGNGFHVPYDRMIRPYPRYAELHVRRHHADAFSVDDLRDLQVWHKLVWMDPDWLATDPRLRRLLARGRGFAEDDKAELREVELELLRTVVPAYQQAAARGQVELSTSPFYHPILPLLCDTDVHFRAQPHSALPRGLAAWPAAAREQIVRAVDFHRDTFGAPPAGMWPSEGSVSDAVFSLLAESSIGWTATDEEILARSLERAVAAPQLYRPYEVGPAGKSLRCLFRDHRLSDLIGFAYQSWDAERAADDFLTQVREAGRRFSAAATATDTPVVTVVLDGENAWEHYAGGGRPFLRALYGKLGHAADVKTVTMSEAASGPADRLPRVFPGSWINGDFYIWAGHADDHRAWRQLAEAHARFDERSEFVAPDTRAIAAEELRIAEGSDWFWWYGDDHSSDQDAEFDDLYRRHLRNCYVALGLVPPDELFASNITTGGSKLTPVVFRSLDTPAIGGAGDHIGDWARAVRVPLRGSGGTMHQVSGQLIKTCRLAVDRSTLYIRLEGDGLVHHLQNAATLDLLVERPRSGRVRIYPSDRPEILTSLTSSVVVGMSFRTLGSQAGDRVQFSILLSDHCGQVLEQQPAWPVSFDQPSRHLTAVNWAV